MTDIDEKYFSAIRSEAKWNYAANNKTKETTDDKADVDSNSMTQGDRDYFNVVKTEDGISKFLTNNPNQVRIPQFQFHQVQQENKKPIVGLYLQDPLL